MRCFLGYHDVEPLYLEVKDGLDGSLDVDIIRGHDEKLETILMIYDGVIHRNELTQKAIDILDVETNSRGQLATKEETTEKRQKVIPGLEGYFDNESFIEVQ